MISKISLHINKDFHTHDTQSSSSSGLHMGLTSTTTFGLNSLEYKAAYEWNQFSRVQPQITNANSTSMKRLLKTHFMHEYKTISFLFIFFNQ